MRAKFVSNLSNVQKFMAGTTRVEKRGALEASWQLVEGDPGLGKSRTLEWWATQKDVVLLRAKSSWTPSWALRDLLTELGLRPDGRHEQLFNTALAAIARQRKPIIVDEIQHCLKDKRVVEVFRDISDMTLTPVIIGGHLGISRTLKRFDQIYSRIADVTVFDYCTLEDVAICCTELCEGIEIAEDLVAQIHLRTSGRLREMMNAIAEVERFGRKHGKKIMAAADIPLTSLTNDGKARSAAVRLSA